MPRLFSPFFYPFFHMLLFIPLVLTGCQRPASTPATPPLIQQVPIMRMPDWIGQYYTLPPDQRLLKAIVILHQQLTGQPPATVASHYQADGWHLFYHQQPVGVLPFLPSWQETQTLLIQWISALKPPDLPETPTASYQWLGTADFFNPLQTLKTLDQHWRQQPSRAILQQAIQTWIYLVFQHLDYLQQDDITAHAWAFLALGTWYQLPLAAETALFAEALDYTEEAFARSAQLSPENPAWAYFRQDFEYEPQTPADRYLQLFKAATQHDNTRWQLLRAQQADPPHLAFLYANLRLTNFAPRLPDAEALPLLVTLQLAQAANPQQPDIQALFTRLNQAHSKAAYQAALQACAQFFQLPQRTLVQAFEAYLMQLLKDYPPAGYFLPPKIIRAYYEGYFYSTLYFLALHQLESPATTRSTTWTMYLGEQPTTPLSQALTEWVYQLQFQTATDLDRYFVKPLQRGNPPFQLGSEALEHTYLALLRQSPITEAKRRLLHKRFCAQLDSRISNRSRWFSVAWERLRDKQSALALAQSITQQGARAQPEMSTWYYCQQGDWLSCQAHWQQPGQPLSSQLQLLSRLPEYANPWRSSAYQQLTYRQPQPLQLAIASSRYWLEQDNFSQAGLVLENWLAQHDTPDTPESTALNLLLAEILYRDQRWDDAESLLLQQSPAPQQQWLWQAIAIQKNWQTPPLNPLPPNWQTLEARPYWQRYLAPAWKTYLQQQPDKALTLLAALNQQKLPVFLLATLPQTLIHTHPEQALQAFNQLSANATPEQQMAFKNFFPPTATPLLQIFLRPTPLPNAFLERHQTPAERTRLAYYLGLRAQHQHNENQAIRWFQVTQELAQTTLPEYHWAYQQLFNLQQR